MGRIKFIANVYKYVQIYVEKDYGVCSKAHQEVKVSTKRAIEKTKFLGVTTPPPLATPHHPMIGGFLIHVDDVYRHL